MKLAILFIVILIAFSGCQKAERIYEEPEEVHEINIGTAGGNVTDKDGNNSWQFYYFWRLDLVNDSVYTKLNPFLLMEEQVNAEIEGGKFPLMQNKIIQAFIAEAANTKNYTYFREPTNTGAVCGPNLLVMEYKRGKTSKIFFFIKDNKACSDLRDLLNSSSFKEALFPVHFPINLHDDGLVTKIKNSAFFDSLQTPPAVQKTIKFTPPVETEKLTR